MFSDLSHYSVFITNRNDGEHTNRSPGKKKNWNDPFRPAWHFFVFLVFYYILKVTWAVFFCVHRIRRGVWCVRTCCIPIITLLHRSQNGQASHWLSLSCLPHNSASNAFVQTIPQLPPGFPLTSWNALSAELDWVPLLGKVKLLWLNHANILEQCWTLQNIVYLNILNDLNVWELLGKRLTHHKGESVFFCVCHCQLQEEYSLPTWYHKLPCSLVTTNEWSLLRVALMKWDSISALLALWQNNLIYLRGTYFHLRDLCLPLLSPVSAERSFSLQPTSAQIS